MSRSLNKVQLIGHLGGDPEVRTTPGGAKVAQFSLATSRSWTAQSGEKQEKTEWHKCVAWNRGQGSGLADIAERYAKKGDKVYVEGRLDYRQYEKDGETRYVTEIVVEQILLLGSRSGGDATGASASRSSAAAARPASKPAPARAQASFEDFPEALPGDDDDLPF